MPINTKLLVSAAMLQDYFVDNATGLPMADGTITMYQDNSRTTLKNWYYQTGVPGNYTYITLPNPMILSGVGTIQDGNGNDVIPFYYPYDENDPSIPQAYYVVVENSNGQSQFTRQNFPFITQAGSVPTGSEDTNKNLIVNNVFWRNIGSLNATTLTNSTTINGSQIFYATLAPSQHDGFTMSDIQFFKNANGATDTITFFEFVPPSTGTTFPDQILQNDVTPEFYLNVDCSAAGTETTKYIQIPLSLHVKSLSGYPNGTVTIQAMAVPGSSNGQITVGIFQYLGSGVTSPITVPAQTIPLGNSWQKYPVNIPIPTAANLTLGQGGDDALYLQIGYPSADTCNINIAVPSFYLSESVPIDDFQTYDEVNAIVSSPRTGDVRTSMNSFSPFGWVPMNDGTIGSSSSNATTRANTDTWPLYNLLWNLAKPYDTGSNFNAIIQLYNSSGSNINYGSTAIGDFTANNRMHLPITLGRVILGGAPISSLLNFAKTTFNAANAGGNLGITTDTSVNYFNGMPIVFTNSGGALPGGLAANAVYYVATFSGGVSFTVATTFANAMAGTVLPFVSTGTGTQTVSGFVNGTTEGEYGHVQLLNEMIDHTHNSPGGSNFVCGGASAVFGGGGLGSLQPMTDGVTNIGAQTAFNVTQPGVFYNIFMKL